MTTTTKTFEVWGVTRAGGWEYQGAWRQLTDAERLGRVVADGYAKIVIREVAA